MPRSPPSVAPASRRRRNADEARTAILDAAEKRLAASGPAAIRLQKVAADVGVSHPTVLHHFGSREALVEAVVRRAIDSLEAHLLAAVKAAPSGPDDVSSLIDAVFDALVVGGHGRTFLWLSLSGYAPDEDLHIRPLAEVVHAMRQARRTGKKRIPPFEDTYFTILLPALALLALSAIEGKDARSSDDPLGPRHFRSWLARLVHEHLERE
jgi:AcrR family transcriptional regulator